MDNLNEVIRVGSEIMEKIELKDKFILDACCGPRMMWFNKKHPNTIYIDVRRENGEEYKGDLFGMKHTKGYNPNRQKRSIQPDFIMDNRKLDFSDNTFKLVVMDPPHLFSKGNPTESKCIMIKDYGGLNPETWQSDIKKGFDECWRVLQPYGILIFKWNDASKDRGELLKVLGKTPLFGHPNGSKIPTHWFCFMKIPEADKGVQ